MIRTTTMNECKHHQYLHQNIYDLAPRIYNELQQQQTVDEDKIRYLSIDNRLNTTLSQIMHAAEN